MLFPCGLLSRTWATVSLICLVYHEGICNSLVMHPPKYPPPPFHGLSANRVVTHKLICKINTTHVLVIVRNYLGTIYLPRLFIDLPTNLCFITSIDSGKSIYIFVVIPSCGSKVFVIQNLWKATFELLSWLWLQFFWEMLSVCTHSSRSASSFREQVLKKLR